MKFKLDENFGARTQRLFQEAGYEVETVLSESLSGASDVLLYETCQIEQRCLVTLDLDFANTLQFPPQKTGGIIVIHVPHNPSLTLLETLVNQFLQLAAQMPVERKLWIVEVGRVRIHQSDAENSDDV